MQRREVEKQIRKIHKKAEKKQMMKEWIEVMRKVVEKKMALLTILQRKRKVMLKTNFKIWCKTSFLIKICDMLY